MKDDYITNSHYITYIIHFEKLGECTFWTWEWKGQGCIQYPTTTPVKSGFHFIYLRFLPSWRRMGFVRIRSAALPGVPLWPLPLLPPNALRTTWEPGPIATTMMRDVGWVNIGDRAHVHIFVIFGYKKVCILWWDGNFITTKFYFLAFKLDKKTADDERNSIKIIKWNLKTWKYVALHKSGFCYCPSPFIELFGGSSKLLPFSILFLVASQ